MPHLAIINYLETTPRLCRHLTIYILYLFSFSSYQENEWYQHIDATLYQIACGIIETSFAGT